MPYLLSFRIIAKCILRLVYLEYSTHRLACNLYVPIYTHNNVLTHISLAKVNHIKLSHTLHNILIFTHSCFRHLLRYPLTLFGTASLSYLKNLPDILIKYQTPSHYPFLTVQVQRTRHIFTCYTILCRFSRFYPCLVLKYHYHLQQNYTNLFYKSPRITLNMSFQYYKTSLRSYK